MASLCCQMHWYRSLCLYKSKQTFSSNTKIRHRDIIRYYEKTNSKIRSELKNWPQLQWARQQLLPDCSIANEPHFRGPIVRPNVKEWCRTIIIDEKPSNSQQLFFYVYLSQSKIDESKTNYWFQKMLTSPLGSISGLSLLIVAGTWVSISPTKSAWPKAAATCSAVKPICMLN